MRQYGEIKKKYPGALLFFRLGDFYEMFYDDAIVAARELQITLTSRNKERGEPVPMCGVPYHAAETYLGRLIRKGYKVAVCEQMENPSQAKKLVRREVTRVVTPGTAADAGLVSPRENNFLVASCRSGDRIGLACVDVSTGEFRATEFAGPEGEARLAEELDHLAAREIVFPAEAPPLHRRDARLGFAADDGISGRLTRTPFDDWAFGFDYADRASAAGAVPRAFARRIWSRRSESRHRGGRGTASLPAGNSAGDAGASRPDCVLRAAALDGARLGDGAEPGIDGTGIRRSVGSNVAGGD
jgi:DNA mismatch repair protein MutS